MGNEEVERFLSEIDNQDETRRRMRSEIRRAMYGDSGDYERLKRELDMTLMEKGRAPVSIPIPCPHCLGTGLIDGMA